jgi:hypothetical protein
MFLTTLCKRTTQTRLTKENEAGYRDARCKGVGSAESFGEETYNRRRLAAVVKAESCSLNLTSLECGNKPANPTGERAGAMYNDRERGSKVAQASGQLQSSSRIAEPVC